VGGSYLVGSLLSILTSRGMVEEGSLLTFHQSRFDESVGWVTFCAVETTGEK